MKLELSLYGQGFKNVAGAFKGKLDVAFSRRQRIATATPLTHEEYSYL